MKASITELNSKIKNRELSVWELVSDTLQDIKERDSAYNSFITIADESTLRKRSDELQEVLDKGNSNHPDSLSPIFGIPIAVKDNICTKNLRTSCASKMLEHFVPPYSATAVELLEDAGAIIVGKTNMDEFAMGSTTETSYFGSVKNPHDISRVAGGSSGGSAAAVAAGEVVAALGSDTGGSIRLPSAYCGVTGLKPTYGTVSRYGLTAYASSLDQIGPIAANVSDCAVLLDIISKKDHRDMTYLDRGVTDFSTYLTEDVRGMKIGIPREYYSEKISPEIAQAVLEVGRTLERVGAILTEIDILMSKYAVADYYIIACAEASSNLARFDGVRYGFRADGYSGLHDMYDKTREEGLGEEVRRRIALGKYVLSEGYYDEYYLKALKVKRLICEELDRIFEKVDVILTPVSPTVAPRLGELADPMQMYLNDTFTVSANLAGLPAISFPCGHINSDSDISKGKANSLPIGAQLMGKRFDDGKLIQAVFTYENLMKQNGSIYK